MPVVPSFGIGFIKRRIAFVHARVVQNRDARPLGKRQRLLRAASERFEVAHRHRVDLERPGDTLGRAAGDAKAREGPRTRPEGDETDFAARTPGHLETRRHLVEQTLGMTISDPFDGFKNAAVGQTERGGRAFARRIESKQKGCVAVHFGIFVMGSVSL